LALRNVLRHRFRSAVTFGAICVGVVALSLTGGFVRDIFFQLAEAIVHSETGHLQITRRGFRGSGSRSPEHHLLADLQALRDAAYDAGAVNVMARVAFSGLLNNGRADLPIVGQGVEPVGEAKLGSYVNIVEGRNLTERDRYGAIVGHGVASALKLVPGDRVTILASTRDGALNTVDFDVVGVFRSFSRDSDARAVRITLPAAQELLGITQANVLVVELPETSQTATAVQILRQKLARLDVDVAAWNELDDFYDKAAELYRRQFAILRLVVLLMVVLSVLNTINLTVFERTAEFGTMRSLGNGRRHVLMLIVLENLLSGAIGVMAGGALSVVLAHIISTIGIPMPPPPGSNIDYTAHIRLTFAMVGNSMLVVLAATALASLFPAIRASRMPIVTSLRAAI
jgi:putative ABC transport system permease protein